jgi:PAS domain S-box-containing protein
MQLKGIQQPVFALNRELAVVYVNDSMEQLTGYSAHQLRAMQFVEQLVPPDAHEAMHDALVSVIHEGKARDVEMTVVYSGGRRGRWGMALTAGNGMGAYDVLAVCCDLTPDHQRSHVALQNKKLQLQLAVLQRSGSAAGGEGRAEAAGEQWDARTSLVEFLELERRIKEGDAADLDDISARMAQAAGVGRFTHSLTRGDRFTHSHAEIDSLTHSHAEIDSLTHSHAGSVHSLTHSHAEIDSLTHSHAGSIHSLTHSHAGSVHSLTHSHAGSIHSLTHSHAGSIHSLTHSHAGSVHRRRADRPRGGERARRRERGVRAGLRAPAARPGAELVPRLRAQPHAPRGAVERRRRAVHVAPAPARGGPARGHRAR